MPKCGGSHAAFPVERPAVQVHHGFDEKRVGLHTVNDGVGKAVEVELAVLAPDFAPAFRLGHDAAQRAFKMFKEIAAQAGLPFFIPEHRRFQFLVGFRMADDVHGAFAGCPQ